MNRVSIDRQGDRLIVVPRGLDKLWGFARRIEVPMSRVRGATHDPGAVREHKGTRIPGLGIPGLKWTGTWRKNGERHYWNVTGGSDTVVIELQDTKFQRLYLSVEHPGSVVDSINGALNTG